VNPVRSKSPKATAPPKAGTSNGVKRPLVWISLPFICGILVSRFLGPYPFCLYFCTAFLLFLTLLSWRKKLLSHLFLLITIFLLGATLYQSSSIVSPDHIINFPEANEGALLEGKVAKDPSISLTSWGMKKVSLILNARMLTFDNKRYEVTGLVKATIYNPGQRFNYGDELALFGKLTRPRGPSNPGQFDWSRYLTRQRIYVLLTVKDGRDVIILKQNKGNPIVRWSLGIKKRAKSIITKTLPKPQSDILAAVLLGDRQDLPLELTDLFIQTGTIHILPTQYTKKPCYSALRNITL